MHLGFDDTIDGTPCFQLRVGTVSMKSEVYAEQLQHLLCTSFLSVAAESARLWVKVGVPSNSARDSRWICQQLEETAPASSSHAFWAAECATQTWRAFLKKDRVRASWKSGQMDKSTTPAVRRKRLP